MNRKRKNILILVIVVALIVTVVAVTEMIRYNYIYTETIVMTWVTTSTPQDQVDIYIKEGKRSYMNDDGTKIYIEMTKKQRIEWEKVTQKVISNYINKANDVARLSMVVSDEYRKLEVAMGEDVDYATMGEYLVTILYDMELLQLLNGADTWYADVVIKDIDTGNVILMSNFPEEKIRIEQSLWDNQ
jgi:uncharacterized protein (UPF0333 family)